MVTDPAVLGPGVDPQLDQALHCARREAVAAHLLARERRLFQDQHVETGLGQVVRGGRAGRAGTDDDDIGVAVAQVPSSASGRSGVITKSRQWVAIAAVRHSHAIPASRRSLTIVGIPFRSSALRACEFLHEQFFAGV